MWISDHAIRIFSDRCVTAFLTHSGVLTTL